MRVVKVIRKKETFEEMLEKSYSPVKHFEPGEAIKSEVVAISGETVFINLSGKSEGLIEASEFRNIDGHLSVKVGDSLNAFFLKIEQGSMYFTTQVASQDVASTIFKNAFENQIAIDGKVEKEVKGGFEIRLGTARAFCPYSQISLNRVEHSTQFIGLSLKFKIMELSEEGRNVVVSHRQVLEEEKDKQLEMLKNHLEKGMTVCGVIQSIHDFGAFVEIEGIQALLPISEVSHSRIDDLNQILKVGQNIKVVILSLDWATERFSVSMKKLEKDPWMDVVEQFPIGSTIEGTIARIMAYGVFVELQPGVDGLLHISDFIMESSDDNLRAYVKVGDLIEVQIKSIDIKTKRISLTQVSSELENEDISQYLESGNEESYNPFAQLLKK